ncbi:hypothetical protein F0562_008402 [Nyssa sinensis]|uniref:Uncharacterized protein n=1 Tax=Nyssa sinensis TaxID=561372 RepID=A0A5J5A5K0_9ASTE|nr:hypothetical protein F0562_008402 [Nyssa sinensis]
MIVVNWSPNPISAPPVKFGGNFCGPPFLSHKNEGVISSLFKSKLSPKFSSKCSCFKEEHTAKASEGFSVLGSDIPWDSQSTWSTMALYLFSLHIPLSFGGLSVVAYLLHQPVLDPQTQALSLLAIQVLELSAVLWLLKCIGKPGYKLVDFFQGDKLSKGRNWLLASALGFGFLILLLFITSLLADQLVGPKVNHAYSL